MQEENEQGQYLILYYVRAAVREGVLPGGGGVPRGGPINKNDND